MTTAHHMYLNSILTATKEKPVAVSYDFLDKVQSDDPELYSRIIKDKSCLPIPAGFELTEVKA